MATATLETRTSSTFGAEVLTCRRNRRSSVHINLMGITGFVQLILLPPIAALFCTGAVIMFLVKVLHIQGQNIPLGSGLVGMFVTITVGLYFFFFSVPDNPCLVLHKHGFRYRGRNVLFANLKAIAIGRDDSAMSQFARGLGSLISWHPAGRVAENSQQASVTLVFKDQTSTLMKNVLLENNHDDLNKFFDVIKREQSHIRITS